MAETGAPARAACARCGAAFACDPAGACWCAALPRKLKVPTEAGATCLCPRCLAERIEDAGKGSAPSPACGGG
jgi:hypothetical protein